MNFLFQNYVEFLRRETQMPVKGKHRTDTDTSKKRNCVEEPSKNEEVRETIQNWRSIKIQRQNEKARLHSEQGTDFSAASSHVLPVN